MRLVSNKNVIRGIYTSKKVKFFFMDLIFSSNSSLENIREIGSKSLN